MSRDSDNLITTNHD